MRTEYEIIDFHMHPFLTEQENLSYHKANLQMSTMGILNMMDALGVSRFCGSVAGPKVAADSTRQELAKRMVEDNDKALRLREIYGGRYIPGFHITPLAVEESLREMERMHGEGLQLIGELVPYMNGWVDAQDSAEFDQLLNAAAEYGMIVNLHDEVSHADVIDELIRRHRDLTIVIAHPGQYHNLERNLARFDLSDKLYIDISANGVINYGQLRTLIDKAGDGRVIFGTDYPVMDPGMIIGGVMLNPLLTEEEKEKIFAGNAKRLLGL